MAVKDIRSNLQEQLAILAAVSTNTTTNGFIFDTANFELGLMFAVSLTAFTDGAYNFTLEESSDAGMSGAVAVTDADKLIGTLAGLALTAVTAEGDILPTVGVISTLRYVRLNVVSTGVTSGATVVAVATQMGEEMPVV